MTSLAQAWRTLLRRPGFTLMTVLTLAAGIGIVTAAFSVVNAVLLRPLPFPDGDRLVAVYEASPGRSERVSLIAPARLEDWNRATRTFAALSGSYQENVTDTSGPEPERLEGRRVMPRFFEVFAMTPLAGRTFVPDEEREGGSQAAIISENYWTRRFGRSPAAVGARLIVGGTGHTIVGVMPRAFTESASLAGPSGTDVWLPAQLSAGLMQVREARFLTGVGRVRSKFGLAQAKADLARVQAELGDRYPASDKGWSVDVRDLKDRRVGAVRNPLALVFGGVLALFAIAIANAAGLMLVHLHRRSTEFAVRSAIGASRRQIVAAVMQEVFLIALGAAAAGTALSIWFTRAAVVYFSRIPRIAETTVDRPALAAVAGASVAAAMVFGLLPALSATRGRVSTLLAPGGRGTTGGRHRLQAAMVLSQVALGVVLAGCAGLLVRSYSALTRVNLGFDPEAVITFHVGAAWDEDRARIGALQQHLLAELQGIPGVRAAGYANFLPVSGATLRTRVKVDGIAGADGSGWLTIGTRTVTPGYLRALAIPLVAGRPCDDVQPMGAAPKESSVMINRRFAEQFAPGQNLIGRALAMDDGRSAFRIVGVVGDVLEDGPATPAVPYAYLCLPAGSWPDPEYVVRSTGDPRALAAGLRALVKRLDASRPVYAAGPLTAVIGEAFEESRLNAVLLGALAAAAVALAALGLYSLLMLHVSERRRELGVRMALGAATRDVVRAVLSGAGRLVAAGIAVGLAVMAVAARFLQSQLFGVTPFDPAALSGAVLGLTLAALVALVVPVRRALTVSAVEAMRTE